MKRKAAGHISAAWAGIPGLEIFRDWQPFSRCFERAMGAHFPMTAPRHLAGSIHCGIAVVAIVTCASALADGPKDRSVPTKKRRVVQKAAQKPCHVSFGGSAIPEPCDRVGEFPSTASPMHIIGKLPVAQTR